MTDHSTSFIRTRAPWSPSPTEIARTATPHPCCCTRPHAHAAAGHRNRVHALCAMECTALETTAFRDPRDVELRNLT
jgi:hypothetical protein